MTIHFAINITTQHQTTHNGTKSKHAAHHNTAQRNTRNNPTYVCPTGDAFETHVRLGRTDEMEEPGEYLAIDTVWGGPIAVCRGEDHKLYAFANVCCHRGAKV